MADNTKQMYWEMILRMIQTTPNDQELGNKIRKLYQDLPDRFKK